MIESANAIYYDGAVWECFACVRHFLICFAAPNSFSIKLNLTNNITYIGDQ